MKQVSYYFIVLSSFIFWYCSKDPSTSTLEGIVLVLSDSIEISVNAEINVQGYAQLISCNGEEWLSCYQFVDSHNRFYLYNLETGKLARIISIPVEGPNGAGKVAPVVAFSSFDSIFLYQVNANRFIHVDSAGSVLKIINLNHVETGTIYASPAFPPIQKGNDLYFFRLGAENLYSRDFLKASKAEGRYNLNTQVYENTQPSYPIYPDGFEQSIESWKVSRCVGFNGEHVYSFAFENAIHIYDGDKNFRASIHNPHQSNSRSARLTDDMVMDSQLAFLSEMGVYTYLLADPYRRLYYRIFLMPCDSKNAVGSLKRISDYPWLIEILDDQFRFSGRVYFPEKRYNPYGILVSRRGILLPPGISSTKVKEDYLKYDVFTIRESD
jgi:hypothetical protein